MNAALSPRHLHCRPFTLWLPLVGGTLRGDSQGPVLCLRGGGYPALLDRQTCCLLFLLFEKYLGRGVKEYVGGTGASVGTLGGLYDM